jgi:hypothetical protein
LVSILFKGLGGIKMERSMMFLLLQAAHIAAAAYRCEQEKDFRERFRGDVVKAAQWLDNDDCKWKPHGEHSVSAYYFTSGLNVVVYDIDELSGGIAGMNEYQSLVEYAEGKRGKEQFQNNIVEILPQWKKSLIKHDTMDEMYGIIMYKIESAPAKPDSGSELEDMVK